jgi:hypothetical protein
LKLSIAWAFKVNNIGEGNVFKNKGLKTGIAIPVAGRGGPWDCETSSVPHFSRQSAHRWR